MYSGPNRGARPRRSGTPRGNTHVWPSSATSWRSQPGQLGSTFACACRHRGVPHCSYRHAHVPHEPLVPTGRPVGSAAGAGSTPVHSVPRSPNEAALRDARCRLECLAERGGPRRQRGPPQAPRSQPVRCQEGLVASRRRAQPRRRSRATAALVTGHRHCRPPAEFGELGDRSSRASPTSSSAASGPSPASRMVACTARAAPRSIAHVTVHERTRDLRGNLICAGCGLSDVL